MMFIADFHIHSRFSRATSSEMNIPELVKWAKKKGINLVGTGDFTHHLWLQEIKNSLERAEKEGFLVREGVYFVLSVEVSNIFSQNNRSYRVHNVIMAPSLKVAGEINRMLSFYGNLASDGRPILSMSCQRLAEELFKISPQIMLIPAHIWTPWYSLFGSNSGFNSLEEAFGKYTDKITALETGLSSDPPMNWRWSALDNFALVSNSDAHSPSRLGREANVFSTYLNYWQIKEALEKKDKEKFLFTIEMFPQEGKYHYDGHRNCNIRLSPAQRKEYRGICPVCGRPLTVGVLSRVEELGDRAEGFMPPGSIDYRSLIPLDEIIAEARGVKKGSRQVERQYEEIISDVGAEIKILLQLEREKLFSCLPAKVAEGILRVRERKVKIKPGFDGEYGEIGIFDEEEENKQQMSLF